MFQSAGRIALAHDADHLLERGRDDRAARLRRVEERLLVHFLRIMGVADENDVDALVAALQEKVQEQEEALGQILLALAHRARDVHEAEHHGLRARHGLGLEGVEAHVERDR